jgi:excisionase family DNA binding protein
VPRLTGSLTPDEAARLLALSPELISALLESGHLLCRMAGGEPRIPLEQLEAFFRDGLLAVYRAENVLAVSTVTTPEPERTPTPAPDPPPVVAEAEAVPEPPVELARMMAEPQPVPISAREEADLRRAPRYVPRRQIDGFFNETRFSIVQISESGLRIRHRAALLPGEEAKVSFALLKPAQSVVMRARVVWTSMAHANGETFSISGLRVLEHADRLVTAVAMLRASHDLQPERRARQRRAEDAVFTLEGISDEEIARVVAAVQKFAGDPVEAGRWYSRARFAISDAAARKAAPEHPRDREEVLGIWEYLDRQIEIPKITSIVTWTRKAKAVV